MKNSAIPAADWLAFWNSTGLKGGPSRSPFGAGSVCWWWQERTMDSGRQVSRNIMTPDEFRVIGHRLIDWIADYRATVANRPVMARTAPGEVKAGFPAAPPATPEDFDAVFRDLERDDSSRPFALAASQLFRLFPGQFVACQRAGRLSQHRPGRAGPVLAIESGPHRARGSGHRLGAPDGRPSRAPGAA